MCVCLKVVVNGLGGAGGEQDTENTELMAIYTRENQSADKVEKKKTTALIPIKAHIVGFDYNRII